MTGWEQVEGDTWMVRIPNSFFGDFNPYSDLIHGDWFGPKGRQHHTGAVYLNGHWLTEATSRKDVVSPTRSNDAGGYLFNVLWLQIDGKQNSRIASTEMNDHKGLQTAPAVEEGDCIGFIQDGHWAKYDEVDFGPNAKEIEFRVASQTAGGIIEIRLDAPDGDLLGECTVPSTGDWQAWKTVAAQIVPTSGKKTLYLIFRAAPPTTTKPVVWFAEVDGENTTIWANFQGVNPDEELVEINVRQSVFFPEQTGINYITVRGFTMEQAATPWAPPTAKQIGLIGTHWSKAWVIEDNTIRYSTCVGVALGKYGDEFDNKSATANAYNKTIERALQNGWSKEKIGSHIVHNNNISHCEQAGIVGSMGAVFSEITDNVIQDIHVRKLFSGAEMAGIKIHAAIDTLVEGNHICRSGNFGIWLDWMAQGARVSGNILHDNQREDLFVEVNHGPFVVDNNIMLSQSSLLDLSQGGCYTHNLFAGGISTAPQGRETPYHKAHSTELAGLSKIGCGDNRFYNNIFAGPCNLSAYDNLAGPMFMAGNVYLNGATPSKHDESPLVLAAHKPAGLEINKDGTLIINIYLDPDWRQTAGTVTVQTDMLGQALIPKLPFRDYDGEDLIIAHDFFGNNRDSENPFPGPFERIDSEQDPVVIQPPDKFDSDVNFHRKR